MNVVQTFVQGGADVEETLREPAELAVEAVDADMAGLTVRDERHRPTTVVYTDHMVPELDQTQYDWDSGPCLDASRTHTVSQIDDSKTDTRWPEFAAAAAKHGIRSVLSLPVVGGGKDLGALNFYDHRVARYDESSIELGKLFAGQCAIVGLHWTVANEAVNLAAALEHRGTIEQAKGVIMTTTGCSPDDAFDLLREQSQRENRKVREIAQEIVDCQKR